MSATIKIVPVGEFDLAWHERAIADAGDNPMEVDGTCYPSAEDHRANRRAIAAVKSKLGALTAAERRASRWPTRAELWAALDAVALDTGCKLQITRPVGSTSWSASLDRLADDLRTIVEDVSVYAHVDRKVERYYCNGSPKLVRRLATAIAATAGTQVTFLAEDYSPADYTAVLTPPKRKKARA